MKLLQMQVVIFKLIHHLNQNMAKKIITKKDEAESTKATKEELAMLKRLVEKEAK